MNSSSKKPSYAGKDVFIGIDVHKRTYCVAVVVEGMLVRGGRLWQCEQLARQLQGYFPAAICTVLMKRDFQDLFTGNLSQLGLRMWWLMLLG